MYVTPIWPSLHGVNIGEKRDLIPLLKILGCPFESRQLSSVKEKQGTVCLEDGDRKNWVRKGTTDFRQGVSGLIILIGLCVIQEQASPESHGGD